jgi:hypothetical protein
MNPRKKLDDLLHTHDVDVCRLSAVYCYCSAVSCAIDTLFTMHVVADVLLGVLCFFMGRAFQARKSWPRGVSIALNVLGVLICGAFLILVLFGLFSPSGDPDWPDNGSLAWFVSVVTMVLVFVLSVFSLLLLFSKKMGEEMTTWSLQPFSTQQPVSPLNRHLHFITIGVVAVLTLLGIAMEKLWPNT